MAEKRGRKKSTYVQKKSIFLVALILVLVLAGGTLAKYVFNGDGEVLIFANRFYFSSNLLTKDESSYTLNMATEEVSFTLRNYDDVLRPSEESFSYTISVKCEGEEGTGGAVLDTTSGEFAAGVVASKTIKLSGLTEGKTYVVTAVGDSAADTDSTLDGYRKTIEARFIISENNIEIYQEVDTSNDAYVLLNVWTENLAGDVTINYPTGLIPDNTDSVMEDATPNYNKSTGKYVSNSFVDSTNFKEGYSSYSYRFFIDEASAEYKFTVILNDGTTNYTAQ